MDQDYRPLDDKRTTGGVGCVGVGFEDVRVNRAPRGGWDPRRMGWNVRRLVAVSS